jgi:hypothetical protein
LFIIYVSFNHRYHDNKIIIVISLPGSEGFELCW